MGGGGNFVHTITERGEQNQKRLPDQCRLGGSHECTPEYSPRRMCTRTESPREHSRNHRDIRLAKIWTQRCRTCCRAMAGSVCGGGIQFSLPTIGCGGVLPRFRRRHATPTRAPVTKTDCSGGRGGDMGHPPFGLAGQCRCGHWPLTEASVPQCVHHVHSGWVSEHHGLAQ